MAEVQVTDITEKVGNRLAPQLQELGAKVHAARIDDEAFSAIVCREPMGNIAPGEPDMRWHISISGEENVPPWSALVALAHHLRPGVVFGIALPPQSWWINVQPNTLHLIEVKDENWIAQMRFESRGDRPT